LKQFCLICKKGAATSKIFDNILKRLQTFFGNLSAIFLQSFKCKNRRHFAIPEMYQKYCRHISQLLWNVSFFNWYLWKIWCCTDIGLYSKRACKDVSALLRHSIFVVRKTKINNINSVLTLVKTRSEYAS